MSGANINMTIISMTTVCHQLWNADSPPWS